MNAVQNSINLETLTPDEISIIEAYRLGQAERAKSPESAAPAGQPLPTLATGPEASEESEIAAISAQFKQMTPKQRRKILDELWQEAGQPSPASKQAAPTAEPVELPEYVTAQIVIPLALSVFNHCIDPMDAFSQKYTLHDFADWMADAVPAALEGCDHVALSAYLKAS